MKILVTGASGFLGKIIVSKLRLGDAEVKTLGRATLDDYQYDLSSNDFLELIDSFGLVIHCAGKAHAVPKTDAEKQAFFDINLIGTKRLLEALEKSPSLPRSFVFVSTIAVYGKNFGELISEEVTLSASDAYGLSKVEAEKLVIAWCYKNNIICSILRLPLIAGPNPPGNLASMIKGIEKGYYFDIAGGKARKSIVLAEDIANIIPKVAKVGGIYNLTDRSHPSFSELSLHIAKQLGKSKPFNIPDWLAVLMAKIGDVVGAKSPINSAKLRKIKSDLTFDDQKAVAAIGWNPTPVLEGFKIK